MYLVDTNIFLEVLLSGGRKKPCKRFLGMLRDGKRSGVITDFTVHSIIVIMEGFGRLNELKKFLYSLTAYKGLHVFLTGLSIEVKAVKLALKGKLDMDDAIQYSSALSIGAECIVSYDTHFDNLKVPRKTPEDLAV